MGTKTRTARKYAIRAVVFQEGDRSHGVVVAPPEVRIATLDAA